MQQKKIGYPIWILYWTFLVVSFSLIGFFLVAHAMGYRYNPTVGKLQKTGMLIVATDPKDATLSLDSKQYTISKTTRLPNILPGNYRVKIENPGYETWQETLTISPGYVTHLGTVTLYHNSPSSVVVTPQHELLYINALPDEKVRVQDNELWLGSQLVSRFSTAPTSALLLPSKRQIIYALGNEIRIIEIDGKNDQLLYARTNNNQTLFALEDDTVLIFRDGSTTVALEIR